MKYQIMVMAPEKDDDFMKIERVLEAGFRVKWGKTGEIVMIARPMKPTGEIDKLAPAAMLIEGSRREFHRDKKLAKGYATVIKGWPGSLIEVPDSAMHDNPDIDLDIAIRNRWTRMGMTGVWRKANGWMIS